MRISIACAIAPLRVGIRISRVALHMIPLHRHESVQLLDRGPSGHLSLSHRIARHFSKWFSWLTRGPCMQRRELVSNPGSLAHWGLHPFPQAQSVSQSGCWWCRLEVWWELSYCRGVPSLEGWECLSQFSLLVSVRTWDFHIISQWIEVDQQAYFFHYLYHLQLQSMLPFQVGSVQSRTFWTPCVDWMMAQPYCRCTDCWSSCTTQSHRQAASGRARFEHQTKPLIPSACIRYPIR